MLPRRFPIALHLRRELLEVVEADLLLKLSYLGDERVLEPVVETSERTATNTMKPYRVIIPRDISLSRARDAL
jgi:hypothetical protein